MEKIKHEVEKEDGNGNIQHILDNEVTTHMFRKTQVTTHRCLVIKYIICVLSFSSSDNFESTITLNISTFTKMLKECKKVSSYVFG